MSCISLQPRAHEFPPAFSKSVAPIPLDDVEGRKNQFAVECIRFTWRRLIATRLSKHPSLDPRSFWTACRLVAEAYRLS